MEITGLKWQRKNATFLDCQFALLSERYLVNTLWNLLQAGTGASRKKAILTDKKPSAQQDWLIRNV